MCRFAAYLGPPIGLDALITRPVNSLIHQSFKAKEREEPLNGDGFGVGWYVPEISERPASFRSVTPAWNNVNLLELARVTRSRCIFAHVRAASPGLPVMETNCHPFVAGGLMFMHNGYIPSFVDLRRELHGELSDAAYRSIRGSTDSETAFALFQDALSARTESDLAERLASALSDTIGRVVDLARGAGVTAQHQLNLAVTDGEHMAVSRFATGAPDSANSLYVHDGQRYVCEGDVCRMLEPDDEGAAVLVTSEPLSEDPGWQRVPANHSVIVSPGDAIRFESIEL